MKSAKKTEDSHPLVCVQTPASNYLTIFFLLLLLALLKQLAEPLTQTDSGGQLSVGLHVPHMGGNPAYRTLHTLQ